MTIDCGVLLFISVLISGLSGLCVGIVLGHREEQ